MKTFVFDLDGVIYLSKSVIPGAATTVATLKGAGAQVLFATNGSARTPGSIAHTLSEMLEQDVDEESVLTSALAAAQLLAQNTQTVHVMGGKGIVEALAQAQIAIAATPETSDATVVGIDHGLSYQGLSDAVTATLSNGYLIGTNSDVSYPTPEGLKPGGGTLAHAVGLASGVDPVFAGKPCDPMLDLIASRIEGDEVWMVGDRPDTDLAMAKRAGWGAALVLTGVTERAADVPTELAAEVVFDSVEDVASGLL